MTFEDPLSTRRSPHCRLGETSLFTMWNIPKVTIFQVLLFVVISLILLDEHKGQTAQLRNEFSGSSNWSPVKPNRALLVTQLKAQTSDGANFAVPTTTQRPSSAVSGDIRKLLENYVTYLSKLPDFQKETSIERAKSRTSRDSNYIQFSVPKTFTILSTPLTTSSVNDFKIALDSLESRNDKSEIVLQGSPSNTVITPFLDSNSARIDHSNYYLEMPTERGLTLNLSDEELSTFIDNVLGSAGGDEANNGTTAAANEEAAITIHNRGNTTPESVTLEKSLSVLSNTSSSGVNGTQLGSYAKKSVDTTLESTSKVAVTTDAPTPYSHLRIFENSDKLIGNSNEADINLVSKETSADLKESEGQFYTSDADAVTEASLGYVVPSPEERMASNDTANREDETNSNNFRVIPQEEAELLRELKKTKELLRIQIEKLQIWKISDDPNLEVGEPTITTTAPETTTFETSRGLQNSNNLDSEDILTTTEFPFDVNLATLQMETTTVPSETIGSTAIDLSQISTTSAALEWSSALTTPAPFNENLSFGNYSRANVEESEETGLTSTEGNYSRANVEESEETGLTSTEGNVVLSGKSETTTTAVIPALMQEKHLGTSNSRQSTSGGVKMEQNADWQRTPSLIVNATEGTMLRKATENVTSPMIPQDSTFANGTLTLGNASLSLVNDNARNDSSETMILTHVPKITIIHKIRKSNGNGASDGQSEEETYRETLRKHKDLIKTAMSSISLVPAAFKRYKMKGKNKVNIGEIYLLPNFAGSQTTPVNSRRDNGGSSPKAQFDGPFVKVLGQAVTNAVHQASEKNPIIIRQAIPIIGPKFTFNKIGNKFNEEVIDAPREEEHRRFLKENRAKLYVSYLNSVAAKNQNQNPENIIHFYRPRFINRKRFKKVRIPTGFRVKKKLPLTTISTWNDTSGGGKQVVTFVNASPILITIAQSSEQHNQTVARPPSHKRQEQTPTEPIAPTGPHPQNMTGSLLRQKDLIRRPHDKSTFKVFCTYDAHRSLSFLSNDSRGQFFDIHQLEKNAHVLEQCTYLVFAFVSVNMNGELAGAINSRGDNATRVEGEQGNASTLLRIKNLKVRFPQLQVLVAVGGWDTPPQLFSLLVATSKLRDRLSQNIHKFVLDYDFDGAILSWFYPVYGSKSLSDSQRSTRSTPGQTLFQLDDKQNLVKFMRSLRSRFDSIPHKPLETGLMAPPFDELLDRGFDVAKLTDLVDHLILLSYDYYGSWDDKVHHFAPLYPSSKGLQTERDRKLNINYTLNYWLNEKEAPRDKTVLGVAFYGRSFTLESPANAEPGAKAIGPGIAGPITNKPGLLAFNELCDLYLGHPAVRLSEDEHRITAHLQLFDQWVGFDDELSLYLKTKYAISKGLSGIFLWSLNLDDYRNRCNWQPFPLVNAINKAIEHCKTATVSCKM